ncbi:hypothetical protein ABW21_db0208670 [Orbilia brochopaga]|nr:hypothetical protein ABW21_db0208670 [Drechslerella brochopaga]
MYADSALALHQDSRSSQKYTLAVESIITLDQLRRRYAAGDSNEHVAWLDEHASEVAFTKSRGGSIATSDITTVETHRAVRGSCSVQILRPAMPRYDLERQRGRGSSSVATPLVHGRSRAQPWARPAVELHTRAKLVCTGSVLCAHDHGIFKCTGWTVAMRSIDDSRRRCING